jgi:hypothetical protein
MEVVGGAGSVVAGATEVEGADVVPTEVAVVATAELEVETAAVVVSGTTSVPRTSAHSHSPPNTMAAKVRMPTPMYRMSRAVTARDA